MFHAGLALELSRIIWDDRRAEARAGRRPSEPGRSARGRSERGRSGRTSPWSRQNQASVTAGLSRAPSTTGEDRWWAWRVVEPDPAYLRRRAA
jgi:hypothetical protein